MYSRMFVLMSPKGRQHARPRKAVTGYVSIASEMKSSRDRTYGASNMLPPDSNRRSYRKRCKNIEIVGINNISYYGSKGNVNGLYHIPIGSPTMFIITTATGGVEIRVRKTSFFVLSAWILNPRWATLYFIELSVTSMAIENPDYLLAVEQ